MSENTKQKDEQEKKDNTSKEESENTNKNTGFNFNPNNLGGKKNPKYGIYWVYGIIAFVFILLMYYNDDGGIKKISPSRFTREMIANKDVNRLIIVNGRDVQIFIKSNKLGNAIYSDASKVTAIGHMNGNYHFEISSVEVFTDNLNTAQKKFGYTEEEWLIPESESREDVIGNMLSWMMPIIILIAIWLFIFKRMGGAGGAGGQIFNIGKSKAQVFDKNKEVKTTFKDVAGLAEAKEEVMEIVDFLKKPEKYTTLGGKIPKGALLVGPPGTGKTLLAKAVAGEAHVPFFSMSGSDFVEMFVGVGASRVRDLFKQAKEKSPCIIFIDEIDAVGRARGKNPNMGSNDERENTLNQLLTEMDGFQTNSGVIILAATNRADVLDSALLRAGRFDRQIHVELPDINEREAIFNVHLKPLKINKTLNTEFLAKQTPGFSGADIANVCNEAALIAARQNHKAIEKQDFLDAVDRIVGGLEKKNKIISISEKKTIAYHEAGHATISWLLEHANPLVKVTIIPRGKALGAAWYLPEERQITTTEQLLDEMCSLAGGRAAEEVNFGKISTGALNDLERMTKQAYAMVTYYGMSKKVGNLSYYDSSGQSEYSFTKPYGDKVAELIDSEVKEIVEKQYARAKQLLTENKEEQNKLAELLLKNEVIFTEDVEEIFGKRKFKNAVLDDLLASNKKAREEEKEEKETRTVEEIKTESNINIT